MNQKRIGQIHEAIKLAFINGDDATALHAILNAAYDNDRKVALTSVLRNFPLQHLTTAGQVTLLDAVQLLVDA